MPRNVDMLERVGGIFNHADSLLYPRTHVNRVDGLLTNGKISFDILPDSLIQSLKRGGAILSNGGTRFIPGLSLWDVVSGYTDTLANTINPSTKDSAIGTYFQYAPSGGTLQMDLGEALNLEYEVGVVVHYAFASSLIEDGEISSAGPVKLEPGDWLIYEGYTMTGAESAEYMFLFSVLNNAYGLATDSAHGLMPKELYTKLNTVADNANNYTHPTQGAISEDTNGIEIIDSIAVNTLGHVTAIGKRNLPEATTSAPGTMSASDKTKLNGLQNYSLPTASSTVLGGIKVGSRLSISAGVLSADSQTEQNFTTTLKNKLDAIEAEANKYVHPTQAAKSEDLTTVETINNIGFDTEGHISSLSKQSIRLGTTTQTGILQLASGTELTTALSSTKATTPNAVKSMIDYFAGMKRYETLVAANAATVADGTIALVTVA